MREILFRGKRIDNGEWVEGFLCLKNIIKHTRKCFDWRGDYVCDSVEEHKVDSETVGQFTGLTDKNGKKIFEGDIVKWDEKEWGRPYNELVEFDYELLAMRKHDYRQWCEVIGNIHDNKELLGE